MEAAEYVTRGVCQCARFVLHVITSIIVVITSIIIVIVL